jgi:predicted lipase
MTKGEERMIKNEKQRVETMSNSLTFNLIKDKKSAIQRFKNNLVANTRELPRAVAKMKEKEMEDVIDDYKEKVHAEFEANKRVIRAFKATEHVTKTQYTGEAMPVDNQ